VERLIAQRGAVTPSLESERRRVNPELVRANQLTQWPAARARDAQENFPELIRRLLVETPRVTNISVRSGDGIALRGYDGLAESEGTAFLPAGHLAFEFGVDKDPKRKATEDYNNRVSEVPSEKTFVFVTPQRWAGGPAWAEERRSEGRFANVKVLDADDLEGWLQTAPAAHHWISEHLGLRPRNAITLDTWWSRFSRSTDPILPAELFVAGRSVQATQLIAQLSDAPRQTVIKSEWTSDCLAFIYAALSSIDRVKRWDMMPVIVVSAAEAWDRIVEQPGQSILIPDFEGADVGLALTKRHHVITVIDRTAVSRSATDLSLPRLDRHAAAEAFQATGLEFNKANRLAALGRRSLPALIRQLSRNPRFKRPEWANSPDAFVLAPLVLVGSWTSADDDIAVIERLTGQPRSFIEQTIRRVSTSSDPVLRKVGQNWAFTSPEEAFWLLRESLTLEMVGRWTEQAKSVLLEPDPMLGLSPEDRLGAQMRGMQRRCSGALRQGIGQGFALMGAMGTDITLDDGSTLAGRAARTAREMLDEANRDSSGRLWHLLADSLPRLAESAPDTLLRAVLEDLDRTDPVLVNLFQDEASSNLSLGPSSPHPSLLWALETVCWSGQYVLDGVCALARLAAIEPGGTIGNRPNASLAAILCGWVRHTSASVEERLQALDAAYHVSEVVGWQLIFDLWPGNHQVVTPPATPRFRDDWLPSATSVPMAEWVAFTNALVDRAVEHVGTDPERLAALAEGLTTVSPSDRDRIVDFLEKQCATGTLGDEARLQLWEKLQELVARHEHFATADWAMPPDIRHRLSNLAAVLEPQGNPERFAYLFAWHPDLPGVDQSDFQRYADKLNEVRTDAIRSVLTMPDGMDRLASLARRSAAPSQLGLALADHDEVELAMLLPWFESTDAPLREAAAHWMRRRLMLHGAQWLGAALRAPGVDRAVRRVLIMNTPADSDSWKVLHESPREEDERDYWTTAPIDVVPFADTVTALEQLIAHGRAWSAIRVAAHALDQDERQSESEQPLELTHPEIIKLLDSARLQVPGEIELSQMTSYYLGKLLDHLTSTNAPVNEIARFEAAFFRLLEHYRQPIALNRLLATSPNTFVDLVKLAYRGKNEPRRQLADADQKMATQAWYILRGWEGFPGRREDNSIDAAVMHNWVRAARLALSDADRADIGDELIGQAFGHSPNGADEAWPAEPTRDLIEMIGSRELESGFILGRINSRGVTWRGIYDGGQPEREFAQQYREWSATTRAQWPRTARILRSIAESYERDAIREDLEAELDADQF
jgi:hypothetical protein